MRPEVHSATDICGEDSLLQLL